MQVTGYNLKSMETRRTIKVQTRKYNPVVILVFVAAMALVYGVALLGYASYLYPFRMPFIRATS